MYLAASVPGQSRMMSWHIDVFDAVFLILLVAAVVS